MTVTQPERPAYGRPSNSPSGRLSWPRVIARMVLIVLPGQLVGNFAGVTALMATGVLRDRPGLALLAVVLGGLVAGIGVGLLLRPGRDLLVAYALVGAGIGIAVFLLLLGLAQLRLPDTTPGASLGDFLWGAVIVAVVQSAAAIPLWWVRRRAATS